VSERERGPASPKRPVRIVRSRPEPPDCQDLDDDVLTRDELRRARGGDPHRPAAEQRPGLDQLEAAFEDDDDQPCWQAARAMPAVLGLCPRRPTGGPTLVCEPEQRSGPPAKRPVRPVRVRRRPTPDFEEATIP
jgi:hypothetical protein